MACCYLALLLLAIMLAVGASPDLQPQQANDLVSLKGLDDIEALAPFDDQRGASDDWGTNGRSLLQGNGRRITWRGRFDPKYNFSYFSAKTILGPGSARRQIIVDPTNPKSRQPVLKAIYPKGSWTPDSTINPGGVLLYAYPMGENVTMAFWEATLEYDVYLPPDWEPSRGGKMPGLAGGQRKCSGGRNATTMNCWSARVMWRHQGMGEAYLYVPSEQGEGFCDVPPLTDCIVTGGVSMGRGSFYFQTGTWQRIAVRVRLNDVGKANGIIEIRYNGERKIYFDKMRYRGNPEVGIESVYFGAFYGGGDASWGPSKDTYSYFKNIRVYNGDSP